LLAIDTSTDQAALAIATSAGPLGISQPDPASRHGRNLVPAIRLLLQDAGVTVADLDGFAVGLGPGSYTGLRIGLSAAKTLAYAAAKPLVGIDSLAVIAHNVPPEALRASVVADAQRGDVYVADFARIEPGAALVCVKPARVESSAAWANTLEPGTYVLGPALERRSVELPQSVIRLASAANWPGPHQLALLARDAWQSGRRDVPWFLEPLYLRRSAAEDQWEKRVPENSLGRPS
jgi:tRNA threonylcarbamoyladenosine biosynthesis protein TsaB